MGEPVTYLRVTYRDGDRRRQVVLVDHAVKPMLGTTCIVGREVTIDGDLTDRFHVIDADLVIRSRVLRMDLHYGRLVVA